MDFPQLGNQSAEFLTELLKKLSCFLANVIFHCLKLETMLYKTDETGTVILIKRLHFALDCLYFKGFNNPFKCHSGWFPISDNATLT